MGGVVPNDLHSWEKSLANKMPLKGNWKCTDTFRFLESQEAFVPRTLLTTMGKRCFVVEGKAVEICCRRSIHEITI